MMVAVAEVVLVRDAVMVMMLRTRETRDGEAPNDGGVERVFGDMQRPMPGMIPPTGTVSVAIDRVTPGCG